jgi:hypothetical protein
MKNISWYLHIHVSDVPLPQVSQQPFLLPHLLKSVRDVKSTNFFIILKFEEFGSAVAGHINKNIALFISQQAFGARERGIHPSYGRVLIKPREKAEKPTRQKPEKILDCYFVATIIHFDIFSI